MELRSRVLAEVETGDSGPGVPGPSSLVTEGSGRPVPDTGPPPCSTSEEAGASTAHPEDPNRWFLPDVRNDGRRR